MESVSGLETRARRALRRRHLSDPRPVLLCFLVHATMLKRMIILSILLQSVGMANSFASLPRCPFAPMTVKAIQSMTPRLPLRQRLSAQRLCMQERQSEEEMTSSGEKADDQTLNQRILAISIPALGALAIDPLLGVVDTLFVGRIPDAAPLAALGICASIFNFSFFIFNFLATATTPIISRSLAAGKTEEASRTLGQAFTLAVGLGLSSLVVLELGANPILHAMGTSEAAFPSAQNYLAIRALAAPAVLVASVGNGAFRGLLDTTTPLKILLGANLINFALNPLLIFGVHLDSLTLVPPLGAAGSALSTATAEWISAGAFVWALRQREEVKAGVRLLTEMPPLEQTASLVQASAAVFLRTVAIQTVLTSATGEAARDGTVAVAAHQVAAQLWLLLSFVVDALAVAGQVS